MMILSVGWQPVMLDLTVAGVKRDEGNLGRDFSASYWQCIHRPR
jgi:hypothetical protein